MENSKCKLIFLSIFLILIISSFVSALEKTEINTKQEIQQNSEEKTEISDKEVVAISTGENQEKKSIEYSLEESTKSVISVEYGAEKTRDVTIQAGGEKKTISVSGATERDCEGYKTECESGDKILCIKWQVNCQKEEITAETKEEVKIENNKIYVNEKEIKIMPDTASEKARETLQIKEEVRIELKDTEKPMYEIEGIKEGKILGLINVEMPVKIEINAETGDVENIDKPWWNIIVTDRKNIVGKAYLPPTIQSSLVMIPEKSTIDPALVEELKDIRDDLNKEKEKLGTYQEQGQKTLVESQEMRINQLEDNILQLLEENNLDPEKELELNKIGEKAKTWVPNYNDKFLKDEQQIKKIMGLKVPDRISMQITTSTSQKSLGNVMITEGGDEDLPSNFDWRNLHGRFDYISPIKDQEDCGSCWAFGAVAVLEGSINMFYNDPEIDADLSEQDLVSCFHSDGCKGATQEQIDNLYNNYLKSDGIATEECFPYIAENGICENKCSNWQEDSWKIISYESSEMTIDSIKRAIVENGPVEVGMIIYDDFSAYERGIYYPTSTRQVGGHAVTIVGFGEEDGMGYWIVKNSWGENWGENGYFRIYFGQSGIDEWFAYSVEQPFDLQNSNERNCFDNDNDGYCNWGLGEKPSTCPTCEAIPDCDDSDSNMQQGCGISNITLGSLSVTTIPVGAEVYVKSKDTEEFLYRGTTPLTTNLETGIRNVRVKKEGYFEKEAEVEIVEGQLGEIEISLEMKPIINYPTKNDHVKSNAVIVINATIISDNLDSYSLEYCIGEELKDCNWQTVPLITDGQSIVNKSTIAFLHLDSSINNELLNLKLKANYVDGTEYEDYSTTFIDNELKQGWPIKILSSYSHSSIGQFSPLVADFDRDSKSEISVLFFEEVNSSLHIFNSQGQEYGNMFPKSLEFLVRAIPSFSNKDSKIYVSQSDISNSLQPIYRVFMINSDGSITNFVSPGTGSVSVYDLDGDSNDEIIVYGGQKLSIHSNVGILLNSVEIPQVFSLDVVETPRVAVGNVDNTDDLEIVYYFYNYSSNEYIVRCYDSELNQNFERRIYSSMNHRDYFPVISDLDNDGIGEIIIVGENLIYAFKGNGDIFFNHTFSESREFHFPTELVISDLDENQETEIIVGTANRVFVFDNHGEIVSFKELSELGLEYGVRTSLSVADINNDGKQEIIGISSNFGSPDSSFLFALDSDLNLLWKKKLIGISLSSPVITDIDNNGKLDIVATSVSDADLNFMGTIYFWETDGNVNGEIDWPMFRYNSEHTGSKVISSMAIKETVTCTLTGTTQTQKCYSDKGTCVAYPVKCAKGEKCLTNAVSCSLTVEGNNGEAVSWKSTCSGSEKTIIDGKDETIQFDC